MIDKPLKAIRKKTDSSMVKCLELLRDGKVDAVISAGNTGALMFCSSLIVRKISGIKKVVLAPRIPNQHGDFILADVGANIDLKVPHFLDIANLCKIYYEIIKLFIVGTRINRIEYFFARSIRIKPIGGNK